MLKFIVRRVLATVPTAILIAVAIFFLLHLIPGDPAALVAGERANQELVEDIRRNLGLDQPLLTQFGHYMLNLMTLDFGRSLVSRAPVIQEILSRLPNSLILAIASLAFAAVAGTILGMFSARRAGTFWDIGSQGLAALFVSAPVFWVGMLFIQWFAVGLNWFPAAGIGGIEHLVLPALALAAGPLALVARLVRSETLETMGEDFVRTARGKGLKERTIFRRHVLKNTLIPVITVIGLQFGSAFNGAVVIEVVFAWPGVGRLLVDSIGDRDYPVVQGTLLVVAIGFLLTNLVVDLGYALVDPRIRLGSKDEL